MNFSQRKVTVGRTRAFARASSTNTATSTFRSTSRQRAIWSSSSTWTSRTRANSSARSVCPVLSTSSTWSSSLADRRRASPSLSSLSRNLTYSYWCAHHAHHDLIANMSFYSFFDTDGSILSFIFFLPLYLNRTSQPTIWIWSLLTLLFRQSIASRAVCVIALFPCYFDRDFICIAWFFYH